MDFGIAFIKKPLLTTDLKPGMTAVDHGLTECDRTGQDCGWYDHFWNVLNDQSNLIGKFISVGYQKFTPKSKFKKLPFGWFLIYWWYSRFWLVDFSVSFFLRLFSPYSQISKKKFSIPEKNKFQKFSKISNFSKIKIRSNLLFLKWFCSILVR